MTLPVIATQVDSLNSRVFSAFRPWRRRNASPAAHAAHAAQQGHAADTDDVTSALRKVSSSISLSSSSVLPPPPSTRPDRRSRARLLVAAATPALTASGSPASASSLSSSSSAPSPSSYLYAYSSDAQPASWSGPGGSVYAASSSSSSARDTGQACSPTDEEASPPPATSAETKLVSSFAKTADSKTTTPPLLSPPPPPPPPPPAVPAAASTPPSLKRRRALSDVDGPDTGVLCYKKRRLRRFLITSRLSQPFSQPASHILNRESVASGDKRFLKLAAIMNARRIRSPHQQQAASASALASCWAPPPSTEAVWRAAMTNRFRKRIFADASRGRPVVGAPVQLMNSARLTMVPVSAAAATTAASMAAVRGSSGTHPAAGLPLPIPKAAPLPTPRPVCPDATTAPDKQQPPPPLLPPLLPQDDYPRPVPINDNDDDDDDADCAFPTSQHGSRYGADDDDDDDRPDDEVYADFSVLFSSAATGDDTDWGGTGSEEGLDDYMDELDGIAHLSR